jgi:hypothetical protein
MQLMAFLLKHRHQGSLFCKAMIECQRQLLVVLKPLAVMRPASRTVN